MRRSGPGEPIAARARVAHITVLWAFAVAQPLFDLLESGEIFVAAAWRPTDVVLFAIAVAFVPPAVIVAVEALAGWASPRLGTILHLVFVGALVAVFVAYLIKEADEFARVRTLPLPVLAGVAGAVAYQRAQPVRSFLTLLSPAALLFPALFLLSSPAGRIALPADSLSDAPAVRARTPVVMMVVDELPGVSLMNGRRGLDGRSYPGFASLARDATWFRNATTVHDVTNTAVPAILTGDYGDEDKPAHASALPHNLFTLLRDSYEIDAVEYGTRLCPRETCARNDLPFRRRVVKVLPALAKLSVNKFLPNSVVARLPDVHPLSLPKAVPALGQFVRSLTPGARPALHYFHTPLAHHDWSLTPSGKRYPGGPGIHAFVKRPGGPTPQLGFLPAAPLEWPRDRWAVTQSLQRHLAQARYTDLWLRRTISQLKRTGLYDRSLVIVTADHGIGFQPGTPPRELTRANAPEVLGVPLFIKRPFQRRGRTSDRFVRTIDIVPTIASVLGIRLPWRVDGRPAFGPEGASRRTLTAIKFPSGERFSVSAGAFERGLDTVARARDALFGSPGDGLRLFETGPHRELLGRRTRGLPPAPPGPLRASIPTADDLRSVDLRAPSIPAFVHGHLVGRGSSVRRALAIALNGRVAATTYTYPAPLAGSFGALVPESALRAGRNELELFAISARGGRAALVPVPLARG